MHMPRHMLIKVFPFIINPTKNIFIFNSALVYFFMYFLDFLSFLFLLSLGLQIAFGFGKVQTIVLKNVHSNTCNAALFNKFV